LSARNPRYARLAGELDAKRSIDEGTRIGNSL